MNSVWSLRRPSKALAFVMSLLVAAAACWRMDSAFAQVGAIGGAVGAQTNVTNTFTLGQIIDGSTDMVQLTVQGHSTQTSQLFVTETSAGTDILRGGTASANPSARLGTSTTGYATLGGALCSGAPDTTTATTDEEILATCTIPANAIAAGSHIQVWLTGVSAATANNKTLRVRLGGLAGVVLYSTAAAASNSEQYHCGQGPILIWRTSATTARSAGGLYRSGTGANTIGTFMGYTDNSETTDWTAAQDLVITADTDTAAAGFTLNAYNVVVVQ